MEEYDYKQDIVATRVGGRKSNKKKRIEDAIFDFRLRHGDKFDYSKVDYINNRTKVCIICPIHGEFWQTPHDHLRFGCMKCAIQGRKNIIYNKAVNDYNHNIKIDGIRIKSYECWLHVLKRCYV